MVFLSQSSYCSHYMSSNKASFIRYFLPVLSILTLTGCNTNSASPEYITYFLNQEYGDQPVNQFFLHYGYPAGAFEQTNGGKVYIWASSQYKVQPTQAAPTEFISAKGSYQM